MAQYDVACAAFVAMSSVTEESSSNSMLENTIESGVTPVHVVEGHDIADDDGPTEVTENSILAELGLIERYDGRRNVGEAGTQRVAPGTLFAAQVHPADVPVGSEVQPGYGVLGRDSVVVQTSFATLEDGSACAVPKGVAAADGLVMGSSPARIDDSAAGAALNACFATAFSAAENPFVWEARQNREYRTLACRESGGASRECPQERVSVNPFVSTACHMAQQPQHMSNDNSLLPLLGNGPREETVTIPKRMYYELIESKQHAERMLMIIAQLEAECDQHKRRLDATNVECRLTCERLLDECNAKCKELENRCVQYEHACIKANENAEREIEYVRADFREQLLMQQDSFEFQIRELESKVHNLEQAKARDVHDWYNDTGGDTTRVRENTKTFHMGVDT